jgi:hypothetical protein
MKETLSKYCSSVDMHRHTYRLNTTSKPNRFLKPVRFILTTFIFLILFSCTKDDGSQQAPTIRLLSKPGMISSDTTIAVGQLMTFSIAAVGGSSNLTNLIALREDGRGTSQRALDTSMNTPQFSITKTFTKNLDKKEFWTFIIRDRNLLSDSVSVIISLDTTSGFGPITYYEALIMSAQNESNPGSFFSFISGETYALDAASQNQELINMVYYLGEDDLTMASPGANIEPGIFDPNPATWETRRTTRYIAIDLPPGAFENAQNDSLLIASYTEGEGKRKAKYLGAGSTFSFQTQDLKYGIFRVIEVEGTDAGTIKLDIKIQDKD